MDVMLTVLRDLFKPEHLVAPLVVMTIIALFAILWQRSVNNAARSWEKRQEPSDRRGTAFVTSLERETGRPTVFTVRIPGLPTCYHFREPALQPDTYIIERSHPFDEPCSTPARAA